MAGTTSIHAVPDGVIVRQGSAEVKIWAHQLAAFSDYSTDTLEYIEARKAQEQEQN